MTARFVALTDMSTTLRSILLISALTATLVGQKVPDMRLDVDPAPPFVGGGRWPVVAAEGDAVYTAWIAGGSLRGVYFSSSSDRGQTWLAPIRIDKGAMPNEGSLQVVATNGRVLEEVLAQTRGK